MAATFKSRLILSGLPGCCSTQDDHRAPNNGIISGDSFIRSMLLFTLHSSLSSSYRCPHTLKTQAKTQAISTTPELENSSIFSIPVPVQHVHFDAHLVASAMLKLAGTGRLTSGAENLRSRLRAGAKEVGVVRMGDGWTWQSRSSVIMFITKKMYMNWWS